MSEDFVFPISYRYLNIIIFIAFCFSLVPLYHIYTKAICICPKSKLSKFSPSKSMERAKSKDRIDSTSPDISKSGVSSMQAQRSIESCSDSPNASPRSASLKKNKAKAKPLELDLRVKISLTVSVTLSFGYLLINIIQLAYMFIDVDPIYLPPLFCKFIMLIQLVTYIVSRGILYFFFLLRSYQTFKHADGGYTKCTIYGMLTFPIIIVSMTIIPTVYNNWVYWDYSSGPDMSGHGTFCYNIQDTSSGIPLLLILFTAQCFDGLYAYLSVHLLVVKLFRLIYNRNMEARESDINFTKFHLASHNSNKMVLIISRLVILLVVAIISSQTAIILLLFGLARYIVIIYSIDCTVNIYCLWLNFGFSTFYYQKYFCGKQCIKCCFPLVKSLALTCTDCSNGNINGYQQCIVCCCYCCTYCCKTNRREKQKKIFLMSKDEIELLEL